MTLFYAPRPTGGWVLGPGSGLSKGPPVSPGIVGPPLLEQLGPALFVEADGPLVPRQQEGPLDQLAVLGEQVERLGDRHRLQLLRQLHLAVKLAGDVEELAQV